MSNQVLDTIDQFIAEKSVLILDGGFSNQLSTYDVDFERSELWTANVLLNKPDLIRNVHLDYLRAGSDVITTVTYQATIQKLKKFGYDNEKIHELFRLAIRMAEEAVEEFMTISSEKEHENHKQIRPLIAVSVGSYGAYLCDGSKQFDDHFDHLTNQLDCII